MDSRILIFLTLCGVAADANAQSAPQATQSGTLAVASAANVYPIYTRDIKTPLAPTTFRFNLLSVAPLDGLYYKVYPSDKFLAPYYREVTATGRSRSDTYDYNGPSPLELYWLPAPGQPGVPQVALRHDFTGRQKSMLVLPGDVASSSKNKGPLEFFDIDISPRTFPAGSYMVINLSNAPLAGRFDGKLYKPMPKVVTAQRKKGDLAIDIYAYIEKEERIINVTRSKLWISPNNRYWLCFLPNPKNPEKVQYTAFYEVMSFDASAAAQMEKQLTEDMNRSSK